MNHVERFAAAIEHLPEHEREIVTRSAELVASGAGNGLGVYGPLRPESDRRNLQHEALSELRDFFFYWFAAQIQGELRQQRINTILRDTDPCPDGSEIDRG